VTVGALGGVITGVIWAYDDTGFHFSPAKKGQDYTTKAGAGAKAGFCDEVYAAV
jgi:hypothetical protein